VKSTIKFAFLCGALTVLAAILGGLSFGIRGLSRSDSGILISGLAFAVSIFLAPYWASRKGWLVSRVSLSRSLLAALPVPFLPLAFLIGMVGWGDMQEHIIRRLLHATHRELSDRSVGVLIVAGIVVFGASAIGSLIWISVSVLTKQWRGRTLLILCMSCVLLSGLFWGAMFVVNTEGRGLIAVGLLLVFVSGFLFALAVEMNATSRGVSPAFRLASAVVLLAFVGAGSILFAKSVPEKRFPKLETGPVWTFYIGSTGCQPSWGGPNSSAASNEIAFATDQVLGMAFETNATPLQGNKWQYKSCIFTVDVTSGTKIAQLSIDGDQPIINGTADGHFKVRTRGFSIAYTSGLTQVGEPQEEEKPTGGWTAAKWHNFHSDSHGKLFFDEEGSARLLAQFPCDLLYIHPLGTERILVTACRQFSLFRADGTLIATETFTREAVNFAALSADHHRFAVAVYLWGVGDPSYLEEEKIIVYDADSGKAIVAVPSEPLPRLQSWAALSPDGSLLAVGAQNTLRLFRLPPSKPAGRP
jgi:hypothetical protein